MIQVPIIKFADAIVPLHNSAWQARSDHQQLQAPLYSPKFKVVTAYGKA